MKSKVSLLAILLIAITIILAACTPDASGLILSPGLGKQIAARDAGAVVVVEQVVLKTLADLTEEEKYAGLPPEIVTELAVATTDDIDVIRTKYNCQGCHSVDGSQALAGPMWKNLGNTAVNRVKGESPAFYLYQSIVDPSAFVVPGYVDGAMPKTFKDQMSPTEIAHVIRYMLDQTE